jgi:hypothetical protein
VVGRLVDGLVTGGQDRYMSLRRRRVGSIGQLNSHLNPEYLGTAASKLDEVFTEPLTLAQGEPK